MKGVQSALTILIAVSFNAAPNTKKAVLQRLSDVQRDVWKDQCVLRNAHVLYDGVYIL
jgi:hypothetical protein